MSDVSAKVVIGDGTHHGIPLNLLSVIELMAARDAVRMEVADLLNVAADRVNEIALHDLHVIDVVEQLHMG